MSYDISLKDPRTGDDIHFDEPHELTGGTYALGGTTRAWLNITWNYAPFFYQTIDTERGIRALYGKTGNEAAPILIRAISQLGTDRSDDYWEATPGNAGAALDDLLTLISKAPGGIIDGD